MKGIQLSKRRATPLSTGSIGCILYNVSLEHGNFTIVDKGRAAKLRPMFGVFSWPLSREESLSCHICCDTGPLSLRSRPKDRSIQSHCTISTDYWGYILTRITTRGGNWVNTSTICKSSPPKTFQRNKLSWVKGVQVCLNEGPHFVQGEKRTF